jgi:hypothetical protein
LVNYDNEVPTVGIIGHRYRFGASQYTHFMGKRNKITTKQLRRAAGDLAKELRAKAKKKELVKDALTEDEVNDPAAVERVFRRGRRKPKWNQYKNGRA